MLGSLFARLRQFSRQRRQARQAMLLNQTDAAALASQATPDPARMLVVRNDSIGDYLLYRPWLRRLSTEAHSRGQRLTLLGNALWIPLAQTWDANLVEQFIPVDFGRFTTDYAYRTEILTLIGRMGFGETLYPVHVREPAVENFIRFLHSPVRVASQGTHMSSLWVAQLNAGYTHLLPSTRIVLHEYYRNQEFFEHWLQVVHPCAGYSSPEAAPIQLPATVFKAAKRATTEPYLVLFPGASARQKRWPTRRFAQLARGLHAHYGPCYRVVLAGSRADDVHARRIIALAGPSVPIDNQCGQTDLPGLAALVAGASLLISNDTVAAHLAAHAGTPCLVLLMGENYGKFFPYPTTLLRAPCQCLFPPSQEVRFAQGNFSPPSHDPVVSRISPKKALLEAIALLENQ